MPLMKEIKFAVAQEPKVLITFKDAGTLLAVSRSAFFRDYDVRNQGN